MEISAELKLIQQAKDVTKKTDTWQELCEKYGQEADILDYIPICFSDTLEVSARTEKGIIYLNSRLKKEPKSIPHYIAHESTHFLQQCFSEKATKGSSNSDDYLANPYEIDGFQNQTKFISETEGDEKAEDYIDQVLDHHDVDGKKRNKKKQELLRLAAGEQLVFPAFHEKLERTQSGEAAKDYDGEIEGTPYWRCTECDEPARDEFGDLITSLNQAKEIMPVNHKTPSSVIEITDKSRNRISSAIKELKINYDSFIDRVNKLLNSNGLIKDTDKFLGMYRSYVQPNVFVLNTEITFDYGGYSGGFFTNEQGVDMGIGSRLYEIKAQLRSRLENITTENLEVLLKDCEPVIPKITAVVEDTIRQLTDLSNKRFLTGANDIPRILHAPVCYSCYLERLIECSVEGCGVKSTDDDDFVIYDERYYNKELGKYLHKDGVYLCKEHHGFLCYSCDKGFPNDLEDHSKYEHEGDTYCSSCFWDNFRQCDECGRTVDSEDIIYEGDNGLCPTCHNESREDGVEDTLDEDELINAARNVPHLNQKKILLPLDEKTILAQVLPALNLAKTKSFPSKDVLLQFILKRLQTSDAKIAAKTYILNTDLNVEQIISQVELQLEEMQRFKNDYPNLSGFRFLPVEIKVEGGRTGHAGSVFGIYPSETMLAYADNAVKNGRLVYEKYLSRRGHHPGSLAYARMSVSKGNVIIDNLQTDLDTQVINSIKKNTSVSSEEVPALNWWMNHIKKFWAPYLLDAIKNFGEEINRKIYLTSFDIQKKKWVNLPDRNIDVYEKIPESMGFEREQVEAKPEDLVTDTYTMRRVAREEMLKSLLTAASQQKLFKEFPPGRKPRSGLSLEQKENNLKKLQEILDSIQDGPPDWDKVPARRKDPEQLSLKFQKNKE